MTEVLNFKKMLVKLHNELYGSTFKFNDKYIESIQYGCGEEMLDFHKNRRFKFKCCEFDKKGGVTITVSDIFSDAPDGEIEPKILAKLKKMASTSCYTFPIHSFNDSFDCIEKDLKSLVISQ